MSEKIETIRKSKTPEEAADLERRQLQLIERRHEMAVASLRIEQVLKDSPSDERSEALSKKIDEELSHINPSMKAGYLKVIDRFFKRKKSVTMFYHALMKEYAPQHAPESIPESQAGIYYFQHSTGRRPSGTIRLRKASGCAMAIVDQLQDFIALTETDDPVRITEEEYYVGEQFDMRITVHKQMFDIPFVIVRTDSGTPTETIINHELQHVINNDFIGGSAYDREAPFSLTDQTNSVKGELHGEARVRRAKYFRRVKDEVLAFIRENEDLETTIRDIESYHQLYGKFDDPKERKAAKNLTRDILQSLATIRLWDAGPQGRALLVNLLYPISFERLPQWIPVMRRFYKMRLPNSGQHITI